MPELKKGSGRIEHRIFGYARVSSKEQNLDRQIEQLMQYVSEEYLLTDKASGKDLSRPAYQALKGTLGLRAGENYDSEETAGRH